MRFIKLAIISVFVLFGMATAVSLLIPSKVRISKAINLHRAQPALDLIENKNSWNRWHPSCMNDSFLKANPLHISIQLRTDSSLHALTSQGGRKAIENGWLVHTYPDPDSVTLQWYMDFHLKWYPWQKFSSLFYESTYGVMMDQGLQNLKKITEGS